MNLLFTGRGTSGSWAVRGEQLGAACGAVVKPHATLADCKAADVIVVVKRVQDSALAWIRESGTPWVYDALDLYPQPACSSWSREDAIGWVQTRIKRLNPTAVIWPNARMREDCDDGRPGLVLRHHHRPGIKVNPIRERVQAIGYEGAPGYLGAWRPKIEAECERRGWRFTINPDHLADLDIVLAVRDDRLAGYVQTHWKSNVKLANAHGSGTPFLGQREYGYLESKTGAEYWLLDARGLSRCLDWLESQSTREQVSDRFRQAAYPVERAAADMMAFLHGL